MLHAEEKIGKIKEVLDKFADLNTNLSSETAREIMAIEIFESIKVKKFKLIKSIKIKNNKLKKSPYRNIKFSGERR